MTNRHGIIAFVAIFALATGIGAIVYSAPADNAALEEVDDLELTPDTSIAVDQQ